MARSELDALAVPVAVVDGQGIVTGVNLAFTETFGWAPSQVEGGDLTRVGVAWPPTSRACVRTADGPMREVDIAWRRSADGATLVFHDTRRERELSAILQTAYDGFLLVDREGRVEAPNAAYCQMSGYTADELEAMHMWELEAVHDREACLGQGAALQRGQVQRFETLHRRKDGSLFDVEVSMMMLPRDERKIFTHVRDITDRRRAATERQRHVELQERYSAVAASLVESESRLQAMADTVGEVFWMVDAESNRVLFASSAVEPTWGVSRDGMMSEAQWWEQIHEDDRGAVLAARDICRGGRPTVTDYRVRRPDGGIRWLRDRAYPRLDVDGKVSVICGVASDITEQRLAEEQLRKLWRAVEQSPSLIIITDARGHIEYVNPRVSSVLGYARDELIGREGSVLRAAGVDQASFEYVRSEMRAGRDWHGDLQYATRDGRTVLMQATTSPIFDEQGGVTHFLAVLEDVTERRELETRLQQSQKMEALGLLAGGVAHDFNNLLMLIGGYADCMTEDAVPQPFLDMVSEISAAVQRASSLTGQLLAFSRRRPSAPQRLDLDARVAATVTMLRRLLPESIALQHTRAPQPLTVLADPGMLDQVLLNLAVNARDAMPSGGLLHIQVSRVDFPAGAEREGAFTLLRVADSGRGISPDVLPRIFEPFFTTKEMGKGTGLGLATVYGIVRQHGGWIEVESPRSHGAEFRIYLPLLEAPLPHDSGSVKPIVAGRGERILLVEDESNVRDLVRRLLIRLGYEVVAAGDGAEALCAWRREERRFDLVVTDVVMPGGMSGHELGRLLQQECAEVPVLYLSGYSPQRGTLEEEIDFLPKPCSARQLGAKIRELLDSRVSGRGS